MSTLRTIKFFHFSHWRLEKGICGALGYSSEYKSPQYGPKILHYTRGNYVAEGPELRRGGHWRRRRRCRCGHCCGQEWIADHLGGGRTDVRRRIAERHV